MSWVLTVIASLAGVAVAEVFSARTRRRFVEAFVSSQGWTLASCRYRFNPFELSSLVSYWVVIVDMTGHSVEGTAYATGFVRHRAWIDW